MTTVLKNVQLIVIWLFFLVGPVQADFESASTAYQNQNYALAFKEFSELAEAGDPRAQSVLAIMYKYGESVPLDLQAAFTWYKRAADQGYPPAQFNVGTMYLEGRGVEQDEAAAREWLQMAHKNGYDRAAEPLAQLDGQSVGLGSQELVAWSQSWNLRLPNDIRYPEENKQPLMPPLEPVYRAQLGAMSSITSAELLWEQLQRNHADLTVGYQPTFRDVESRDRTVYRVQLGPFDSKQAATDFCDALQSRDRRAGCMVVRSQ